MNSSVVRQGSRAVKSITEQSHQRLGTAEGCTVLHSSNVSEKQSR